MGYYVIYILTKERINNMSIENKNFDLKQAESLPDNFNMSDKQTFILIRDLFEMVKDNNKLINLLDKRIKLLELRRDE